MSFAVSARTGNELLVPFAISARACKEHLCRVQFRLVQAMSIGVAF